MICSDLCLPRSIGVWYRPMFSRFHPRDRLFALFFHLLWRKNLKYGRDSPRLVLSLRRFAPNVSTPRSTTHHSYQHVIACVSRRIEGVECGGTRSILRFHSQNDKRSYVHISHSFHLRCRHASMRSSVEQYISRRHIAGLPCGRLQVSGPKQCENRGIARHWRPRTTSTLESRIQQKTRNKGFFRGRRRVRMCSIVS